MHHSIIHVHYKILTQIVLEHLWDLGHMGYGLWGMRELWVVWALPLHTKPVIKFSYGILGSMGYQSYGLRGSRLYAHDHHFPPSLWPF